MFQFFGCPERAEKRFKLKYNSRSAAIIAHFYWGCLKRDKIYLKFCVSISCAPYTITIWDRTLTDHKIWFRPPQRPAAWCKGMSMKVNRIDEIDFARVIAMISVITIHVTSNFINYKSNISFLGMNIAFILNQLSRFAVPLFILLSGISCGLKKPYAGTRRFLRGRLIKIGIPYLIWSIMYSLYNSHIDLSAWSFTFFLKSLLLGQAAPHLYFIVIIMQLYVLFPVLKKWVENSPYKSLLVSFIISYGIQKLYYFLKFDFNLIPQSIHPYLWVLLPTWLFYFVMGLILTDDRLIYIRRIASQNALTMLLITLLFAWIYTIESNVTGSLDSIKAPLNIYAPLIFVSSFSAWKYIGRFRIVRLLTRFLAKHSLTIYFEHVFVLYFFRRFLLFYEGMFGMSLLLFAVLMISCLLAILLDGLPDLLKVQKR